MDLGSEIRDPVKTYSGSRIQGSKRHRIPDPDRNTAPKYSKLCMYRYGELSLLLVIFLGLASQIKKLLQH
jgi:hypothetical protein